MEATATASGLCSLSKVSLTLRMDRNARLEKLVGDAGRGYSMPNKQDRVARRVYGCAGTEANVGIERVDHTSVVAYSERALNVEPWGWAEARLATDAIMADLAQCGLLWPATGFPGSEVTRPPEAIEKVRPLSLTLHFVVRDTTVARNPTALAVSSDALACVPSIVIALGEQDQPTFQVEKKNGAAWSGTLTYSIAFNENHVIPTWSVAQAAIDVVFEQLHRIGLHPSIAEPRAWTDERCRVLAQNDNHLASAAA